jgi:hypothetical protein
VLERPVVDQDHAALAEDEGERVGTTVFSGIGFDRIPYGSPGAPPSGGAAALGMLRPKATASPGIDMANSFLSPFNGSVRYRIEGSRRDFDFRRIS